MNKLILILLLLIVVIVAWACKPSGNDDGFKSVDVEEFASLITNTDSVVILDARTPSEFAEGHLPGAILIDYKSDQFKSEALSRLPKDKTIAIYCRSGRRSAGAAAILSAEGYTLVNLKGGIIAWNRSGKETVK